MKNKKIRGGGLVYSTDSETMADLFSSLKNQLSPGQDSESIVHHPKNDKIRIWLDRKNRGGKEATLIEGLTLSEDLMKDLCTTLKQFCGAGGSVKEGVIIIQGDHRDKVLVFLQKKGYKDIKKAGG